VLSGDRVAADPVSDLAEALEGLPGVAAVRQGPGAADPVIRGLGQERVDTRVGVVSLQGACPSRMDPPATYVGPHAIERVTLDRAGQGATFGGGGLGGRVVISPDYERPAGAPFELHGFAGGAFDGARRGLRTEAAVMGGLPWLDFRASGGFERFGDYTAPDGTRVPGHVDGGGAALSLGVRPTDGQRFWQALSWTTRADEAFPALPMDLVSSEVWVYNAGYRLDGHGLFEQLRVQAGYAQVDHVMDNAAKPNRATMEASTPSTAGSFAATAEVDLRFAPAVRLTAGLDLQVLSRDATRTRRMVASGMTARDHLWPDVSTLEGGLYAELAATLDPAWVLTVGARGAYAAADAAAADDPSLGGKTLREQYVAHYGADAGDVSRADGLGAVRATLDWHAAPELGLRLGLGVGMRAPSANERYFAFAPAPGGFRVGDPSLAPERKWEAELGANLDLGWLTGSVSAFTFHIEDFILESVIDRRDVDGDGNVDTIKGYQAVGARFFGAELGFTATVTPNLELPLSVSWVKGDNLSGDKPLPLIPPLFGRAALRVHGEGATAWWFEAGVRFAARQGEVDADYPEDATAAWATVTLRGGVTLTGGLRLEIGVSNLLDATYHDHLTREAVLPVGGLAAGDEIPAQGRSFFATARSSF
jgi:iron complex outermembrane receptor protein